MAARPTRSLTRTVGAVAIAIATLATLGCAPAIAPTDTPAELTTPGASSATTDDASTNPTTTDVVPDVAVGDVVDAAYVEPLREAGHSVFVSVHGPGSGLVVDPQAEVPQVVIDDLASVPDELDLWDSLDPEATASERTLAMVPLREEAAELRSAVRESVQAANFRLFTVWRFLHFFPVPVHQIGWGGGFLVPDAEETRELNDRLDEILIEGVPVGQARLDHWDRIRATPEAYIKASRAFIDANDAQVVIIRR